MQGLVRTFSSSEQSFFIFVQHSSPVSEMLLVPALPVETVLLALSAVSLIVAAIVPVTVITSFSSLPHPPLPPGWSTPGYLIPSVILPTEEPHHAGGVMEGGFTSQLGARLVYTCIITTTCWMVAGL